MPFPKMTLPALNDHDKYGQHNMVEVASILSQLSYPVNTPVVTGGGTGSTVNLLTFVAPEAMTIEKVDTALVVVQTGTGNTPVLNLYNVTQSEIVAATGAIALSGTIGDVNAMTLTAANTDIAKGDVLALQVVTPAATITVAIQATATFVAALIKPTS